jgi:putative transposase
MPKYSHPNWAKYWGPRTTFHRWKRKYGDMDLADAKRLKDLEKENGERKKMLAESMLKIRVLDEVNSKKW